MLISVGFSYRAEGIPKGGRKIRDYCFLADTTIEIAEVSAQEAPVVLEFRTNRDYWNRNEYIPRPAAPVEIVSRQGHLYHRVLRGADKWTWAETRPSKNPGIDQELLADVLDLKEIVSFTDPEWPGDAVAERRAQWGRERIESVPLRKCHSHFEDDEAEVHRRASGLLLRDGALFAQTSEPMWVLWHKGLANFHSAKMSASIVDSARFFRKKAHIAKAGAPFRKYTVFRLDRSDDLVNEARRLLGLEGPKDDAMWISPVLSQMKATTVRYDGYRPALDPVTPAVRHLLEGIRELTCWRDGIDPDLPLEEAAAKASGPMAGFVFPAPGSPTAAVAAALGEILDRLQEVDLSVGFRSPLLAECVGAIPGALRRRRQDIEAGLIDRDAAPLTLDEQESIAALAM